MLVTVMAGWLRGILIGVDVNVIKFLASVC